MQLLGVINDKNYQPYLESGLQGFLFPLQGFACDYEFYYTIDDIKQYKNDYPHRLCFVVCNKMMFNKDLTALKEVLLSCQELAVDGVIFYDDSLLQLKKELALSVPLILGKTHMVTNSDTINLYHKLGVKGAYLSNELTLEEIEQISKKVSSSLMILLAGYPVISFSRRKLLTNYQQHYQKPSQKHLLVTEPVSKQQYLLREDEHGTSFFYTKRLNLSRSYQHLQALGLSYGIIKQDDLETKIYQEVVASFKNFNKERIDEIIGGNRGFLYRKMIYRVKKHD